MAEHQNTQWVLWLYDQIMGQIEPDLLSGSIPLLDEKYKSETPEQHKERMNAYEQAFKIFDEVFKEMSGGIYSEIKQMKHAAQHGRNAVEQKEHGDDLRSADEQFGSPSDQS